MTRTRTLAALAGLLTLAALSAHATSILVLPLPSRFARASAAFVGKVTGIGEKDMPAGEFKGDDRRMKIATVKVSETLQGRPAREIKVGFYQPAPTPPGGPVIAGAELLAGPQVTKGQEGILLLQKHATMKGVYTLVDHPGIIDRAGNPAYEKALKEVKALTLLLADPMKGLKSKDAAERYRTAAVLVTRYKTPPGPGAKTEAVPAAESGLILRALAEGDWEPGFGPGDKIPAMMAFHTLGLGPADGWKEPMDENGQVAAAKKWLKENAGKYKMRRYVREKDAPSEEPDTGGK